MSATREAVAYYLALQAEAERAAEIEAQLQVNAFLDRVSTAVPELDERQSFEWVNSPEAIACAVVIALLVVVASCAGWL
jgi:hypothetical protein